MFVFLILSSGFLSRITKSLLGLAKTTFGLFASTVGSCLALNITASDQFLLSSFNYTSDGGFILIGNIGNKIALFKLDDEGELEWDQTYEFSTIDQGFSVSETLDKGFILGGSIQGIMEPVPLVFKVDSLGNGEWVEILSDGVFGQVTDIAVKADSSYLVTGDIYFFFYGS